MEKVRAVLPQDVPHTFISSVTGLGLVWLKDMLWDAITAQRERKENESFEEEPDNMLGAQEEYAAGRGRVSGAAGFPYIKMKLWN